MQDRLQPNTGEATIFNGSVFQVVGRRVGLKTALVELQAMHASGALDNVEFKAAKRMLLGV